MGHPTRASSTQVAILIVRGQDNVNIVHVDLQAGTIVERFRCGVLVTVQDQSIFYPWHRVLEIHYAGEES